MAEPAQLDHTVINVKFEMDKAQGLFGDLGFFLTERGYHTLGSINHLMMFGTDYLELLGLPPGAENPRPDIAEAPVGINGLVFKTSDADETFAHLQALDMAGDPPKSFSRPVALPDGEQDAAFRTVTVRAGVFPGGRVYFCEHHTPELVWRPEWQSHRNGAQAIPEFVVASNDHAREAEDFAKLLHSEVSGSGESLSVAITGSKITVMSPAAYGERYGALASPMAGRSSIFGALVFRTDSLDKIRAAASNTIDEPGRVVVREASFDSVLEFVE
ncbi:MAG: VOC family protein [Alphaproteobacteria bacterium]|nr:VOC family protein [Alphaproteobacteria bacterium]